jgi:hypothetical protein
MQAEQTLQIVRMTYAAALADAVKRLADEGVLERVTAKRRAEHLANGASTAKQFGVSKPSDALRRTVELFACADWRVCDDEGGGFSAVASRCTLCAMPKRLGAASPCRIYCLDPIEGMVRGLEPDLRVEVSETLFEGEACRLRAVKP